MDELLLGHHPILVGVHGGEHLLSLLHVNVWVRFTANKGEDGVSYLESKMVIIKGGIKL